MSEVPVIMQRPKLVIYTGVFDKPDIVYDPVPALPEIDKFCYTNIESLGVSGYQIVPVQLDDAQGRKKQRHIKIFWPEIFDNYEYSLYLDSNIQLRVDPNVFIDFLLPDSDLLVFRHPSRDCLYSEAQVCIDRGFANSLVVSKQLEKYRTEGYPENNGLYAGGIIFRRHTKPVLEFSKMWWEEVQMFSQRDQISFPYIVWKCNLSVSTFPDGNLYNNPWIKVNPHILS